MNLFRSPQSCNPTGEQPVSYSSSWAAHQTSEAKNTRPGVVKVEEQGAVSETVWANSLLPPNLDTE